MDLDKESVVLGTLDHNEYKMILAHLHTFSVKEILALWLTASSSILNLGRIMVLIAAVVLAYTTFLDTIRMEPCLIDVLSLHGGKAHIHSLIFVKYIELYG